MGMQHKLVVCCLESIKIQKKLLYMQRTTIQIFQHVWVANRLGFTCFNIQMNHHKALPAKEPAKYPRPGWGS